MPSAHLEGPGFSTDLRLRVDMDAETGPQLQGAARVPGAEIEAAKAFWVINKMPPRVVAWLDRALGLGRIVDGSVVFRGNLRDWPFAENQGRLEARLKLAGADLDYHDDWPRAQGLAADVAFINTSIAIEQVTGELSGNRVVRGSGGIPTLKDPVLNCNWPGRAMPPTGCNFSRPPPLRRSYADVLFGMSMTGRGQVDARTQDPVAQDLGRASRQGQAMLHGVNFRDTKWDLQFDQSARTRRFQRRRFCRGPSEPDHGRRTGECSLAVGSSVPIRRCGRGIHDRQPVRADPVRPARALAPILGQIRGRADWNVDLAVHQGRPGCYRRALDVSYRLDWGHCRRFSGTAGQVGRAELPVDLQVQLPASESDAP
ncbi:MAG: hypothetical protein IPO66_04320 [Rhodanobacteraceae bacterium]|nr:hypothetical protein [Rhodanobacteraceae bacterium]